MHKEEWKDGKEHKLPDVETVNQASALWARPKADITEEQYKAFYKHVGHDFDDHARPIENQSTISFDIYCVMFAR